MVLIQKIGQIVWRDQFETKKPHLWSNPNARGGANSAESACRSLKLIPEELVVDFVMELHLGRL